MSSKRDVTAGLIVVGNEILSGKIADTNSTFLAQELRRVGVTLRRVLVIPDELDEIAAAVREFHVAYDVVFTSGGVGPTHDDVTIEGVARGLGRAVVRHPVLEQRLREFFGERINDARLKLADVPEGAELVFDGNLNFPTVKVENIYILPGIPEIFHEKVVAIRDRFVSDPFFLRVIYIDDYESNIAGHLNRTLEAFPDLLLGSYPKLGSHEYRVRVTLESKDKEYVDRALEHLLGLLPSDTVRGTE